MDNKRCTACKCRRKRPTGQKHHAKAAHGASIRTHNVMPMDDARFIYGRPTQKDDKVLVKMYVPRRLKTGLDTLKITRGKNLQQLAAEAIEQYLARECASSPTREA
jgi:hypothetical protein